MIQGAFLWRKNLLQPISYHHPITVERKFRESIENVMVGYSANPDGHNLTLKVRNTLNSGHFNPERFRLNSNHFLTTTRTVSFLFQKDKASIDVFESWHRDNIFNPWHADTIMKWSIASRNTIEKEGDLDLHSTVNATLIFSYIEEQDLSILLDKQTYLGASIKRLIRFARSKLPSGVSVVAVIRVDRRWVANTLPDFELLQAFRYIYTRMYEACTSLAKHLSTSLESF